MLGEFVDYMMSGGCDMTQAKKSFAITKHGNDFVFVNISKSDAKLICFYSLSL